MLAKFIHKTLTPEIAPMVYIMMFVSVIIGFCFWSGLLVGGSESILYTAGTLVHKQLWGFMLFCTASSALYGFAKDNSTLINLGGFTGFMAWLFACISLTINAHWYILLTVGLFHLMFHGYVVLANSLGYLRRRPIQD